MSTAEERWRSLIDQYGRFLRGVIARLCPRNLGVQFDDIEQEARLRLWKALQSERKIEDAASYLYRIAATATIDAVRRVQARREETLDREGDDEGDLPPIHLSAPESSLELSTARSLLVQWTMVGRDIPPAPDDAWPAESEARRLLEDGADGTPRTSTWQAATRNS